MKNKKPSAQSLRNFDSVMHGLMAVSRKELHTEIAKEQKSKPSRSTRRK